MSWQEREPASQYGFDVTHDSISALQAHESNPTEPQPVNIAGRIMGQRSFGKVVFADLQDHRGAIQLIAEDTMTPDLQSFSDVSQGDWLGIRGNTGESRRGEPSVYVNDWVKLAATEIPFPSSREGVKDPEVVVRQRYLDLAVNADSTRRFKNRSKIISTIRRDLEDQDFIEVETPVLQTLYGGAAARPFQTHHNALDMELYMRIAPELYLKRLVVGGLTRVFEIGKVFRNEGISPRHNPEFTMMEVYAAYWDHKDQMELTENLFAKVATELHGTTVISYQGREVDLTPPWRKITMDEIVSEAVGEEVSIDTDRRRLVELCGQYDVPVEPSYGPGKLLLELYEKTGESDLWTPTFVTEYPKEVSPLARDHRNRPGYTERFEGIVAGSEVCNGFSELNDPKEQWLRFKDQERAAEHDEETMPMDHDYIRALKYGLPPTAGLGIGIDRLVMLMTDSRSIRDVVLFPTLRPDGYTTSYEE